MEIELIDCAYQMNPGARGGLPSGYAIAQLRIVANDQDEVRQLINSMRDWADGIFSPVVTVTPPPENVVPKELSKLKDTEIDPLTGSPL